jgi:hypothetical protein
MENDLMMNTEVIKSEELDVSAALQKLKWAEVNHVSRKNRNFDKIQA